MIQTPQPHEMERCLVAALLINPRDVEHIVRQIAPPETFFSPDAQIAARAILELLAKKAPISFSSIFDRITRDGLIEEVGGRQGLADMMGSTTVWEDAEFFADRVHDAYMLRRTAQAADRLKLAAADPSADWEEVNKLKDTLLLDLCETREQKDVINFYDGTQLWINDLERRAERWEKQAISFGVESIDRNVGKIFPGELATIGAETSGGKTMLAMQMAAGAAFSGIPSLVFSLEMTNPQLWDRLFSHMAKIHMSLFRDRLLSQQAQESIGATFRDRSKMPFYVNNKRRLTLPGIMSTIRRMKASKNIALAVIDYLQLVKASDDRGKTRYLDVSYVVQELKELAIELDMVIISPIQLNKEGGARESADIEMSSDFFFKIQQGEAPNLRDGWLWVEKARQGRRHYKLPIELEYEFMTVKSRIASDSEMDSQPTKKGRPVRN